MLIPVRELRFLGVRARGVLHVGAHEAEEADTYARWGWTPPAIWVEMLPDKAEFLRTKFSGDPQNRIIEAACWDSDGVTITINRSDNTQSSSLLPPKEHLSAHPDVHFRSEGNVVTRRLDGLLSDDTRFDFLCIDTQGAELHVLRGLGSFLARVKYAYVEVNEREHYEGGAALPDLDDFFRRKGFVRSATRMVDGTLGWGDALYVRVDNLRAREIRFLKLRSQIWLRWRRLFGNTVSSWSN